MKKTEWTNKENLQFTINELTKIIEIVGNINLSSQANRKNEFKKFYESYDKMFILRKKLQNRLNSLEDKTNGSNDF